MHDILYYLYNVCVVYITLYSSHLGVDREVVETQNSAILVCVAS